MSKKFVSNHAFIDGQNLYQAIKTFGWDLDFVRFRKYLHDRFKITKAYYFIGYIERNKKLYEYLRRAGFRLSFKKTSRIGTNGHKGNVDTDLVLKAVITADCYDNAVIVAGDGDYYCLAKYLKRRKKFLKIIAPDRTSKSSLLDPLAPDILFVEDWKKKVGKR